MELKTKLGFVVAFLALIVVAITIQQYIKEKNTPSNKEMPLTEYYSSIEEGTAMLIMDGKVYDKDALMENGHPYFDLATVKKYFNHRFFWDEKEKNLMFTTPDKVFRFKLDEKEYVLNGSSKTNDYPIIRKQGETTYVSIEFLADYADYTYKIFNTPDRVLVEHEWGDYLFAYASVGTQIRVSQDIKSEIVRQLEEGEKVMIVDGGGIQQNGFIKVMSNDGVRGYARSEELSEPVYEEVKSPGDPIAYKTIALDQKIYLGWQLLYTSDNVGYLENAMKKAPEMNVVSPTWFYLSGTDGDLISYANHDYVKKAHENGLQVWGLYKNDTINKVFNCTEDSFTVLSSTSKRQALIDSIIKYALEYELDGINIDFELLSTATGPHFIEFLRELSVRTHKEGIILSVDNYVPLGYNAYYDIKSQSEVVDYIVIMAYDEHYAGSEEEGSVASIGYTKTAIENTLATTDKSQIIMGVPFYARLWRVIERDDGSRTVSVEATPNMEDSRKQLTAYGVEPEWDEETCQYYGEYERKGATYKIWIEDKESLTEKAKLISEADLAGVAAWKLGDEESGTWEALHEVIGD